MDFTYNQYIDDVLSGRVLVCRWVRLAVQRHVDDLEHGHERGLWFDETAGRLVIAFFSVCRHSKGEWSGQPITLEPWQQFYLVTLFGWKNEDGTRRFRTSYLEVGRKNGKSTMAAGIGLYLIVADGEPGAEVYTLATKRDQARIIHREAVNMVKQSRELQAELNTVRDNIHSLKTFSKFEPLGRDSNTMDGLNVHGGIADEVHAHKDGELWDVVQTATGSRRQPLMIGITTAGHDRQSLCYQFHDYTEKVLSGLIDNDTWHGLIYSLDRDEDGVLDDWEDERLWIKANPNLGVSKKIEAMQNEAEIAKDLPARLNAFLQKQLNVWTAASNRWIDPERWRRLNLGEIDPADLADRRCWGGLDLASRLDVAALVWVFEPMAPGAPFDILCRFWMPEDNIRERVKSDRVPYDAWVRHGYMLATPGDTIDHDFITEQIRQDLTAYDVQELAFDPWNSTGTTNTLGSEGAPLIEFRQGAVSMNPAMMALEVAIRQGTLNHGGQPVLAWMADNLVVTMNAAGMIKPDKDKSTEKIDGMVSLAMAYYRASMGVLGSGESVYASRGVRVV